LQLKKLPERNVLAGYQRENVSFFTVEGERLYSFRVKNLQGTLRFAEYDGDTEKEIAVETGKSVKIFDVKLENVREPVINQSLPETAFIGSNRNILQAIALNSTAFIADNYSEIKDEVLGTGLQPIIIGDLSGAKNIENVNQAFNISREKYFVEDREKAVYVAALAAKNNATITFDRSKSDRDFSNYTTSELQEMFIEKFQPHHVVVADLDSKKGLLASYLAVRLGALPVDFEERSYSSRKDRYNAVMKLRNKIRSAFHRIGDNR
ncbi:MAG: hypothetical protein ABEJ72_09380, partial [Candidatus Aenigmatarchaeota archaeon]